MVGMLGVTWGKEIACTLVFLFNVLRSRTSAALAAAITPARRTVMTKIVRISFIL
jgi:hypothetical protein